MTTFETLLYETAGPIATITLNRPDRLNTIVPPMPEEFESAIGAATVEEEKRIYLKQVAEQMADKPEPIREKIAAGKLDAWYRQNTLLEQEFVKDPSKKVKDVIAAAGKDITVVRFARYVVGEGEPAAAMA